MLGYFFRWRAARQPFPEAWREILRMNVPFYPRLDAAARERFETKLKIFARTKHFIPTKDMAIDDTVVVTISAAAARLVMNLPGEHYQRLTEIVVYKSHYQHKEQGGTVVFGEAHTWGTVVLSYDAVIAGLKNKDDGHNTGMHEFAHVLDIVDGQFDGTPVLDEIAAYQPWAKTMGKAFFALRDKSERRAVLRRYGATNEAEFFAVATEAFFEKPRQMQKRHQELYDVLVAYYRIDPAAEAEP
ncbi:MAG: zinc-dependent peptidase [Deltaproteobacteria bacterium]|nr:zinc-dependent peptidase [Deltaproteobacteria bacterium]